MAVKTRITLVCSNVSKLAQCRANTPCYSVPMKPKQKADIKLSVFVTPEQKRALDKISETTGAPLTFIVRQAIDRYLKENK